MGSRLDAADIVEQEQLAKPEPKITVEKRLAIENGGRGYTVAAPAPNAEKRTALTSAQVLGKCPR